MKKLLIPFSCMLVGVSSPVVNKQINHQDYQNFALPKDWKMTPTTVSQKTNPNEMVKFIVSNIDLTSLNIKNHYDFLQFYRVITIPELVITYDDNEAFKSDTWKVADLNLLDYDKWTKVFTKLENGVTMSLERGYWMYYSVTNRHLMLRFSYRAAMDKAGTISFARGSVINIE